MFVEEATSALAGFHAGLLSWLNWNLEMLVIAEGVIKTAEPREIPSEQGENHQQTQPTYDTWPHWWKVSALTTAQSPLPKN